MNAVLQLWWCQVGGFRVGWPAVQHLYELGTFVPQDFGMDWVDQHWNSGAMGGRRATALIQRKQAVTSQPWRIELPPSCLVICRGRQKIEALIKPSQLMDQPGAMGPWTAASNK